MLASGSARGWVRSFSGVARDKILSGLASLVDLSTMISRLVWFLFLRIERWCAMSLLVEFEERRPAGRAISPDAMDLNVFYQVCFVQPVLENQSERGVELNDIVVAMPSVGGMGPVMVNLSRNVVLLRQSGIACGFLVERADRIGKVVLTERFVSKS